MLASASIGKIYFLPQFGIKIVPKKVGNLRYFLYLCS